MNRIIVIAIVILDIIMTSCLGKRQPAEPDLQYLRNLGYEYAARYRAIGNTRATEMNRQDFLLDVRARETEIRDRVGNEYARVFAKAFADSAFISNIPHMQ